MTQEERKRQLVGLLVSLQVCRQFVHGGVIPEEQIQALEETVYPLPERVDDGGGEVLEQTQIG